MAKPNSGEIVGRNPFTNPLGFTAIPSQLIPVIVRTHSVFAGVANGAVVTAPGVTVFDPTVKDDTCLTPPNDVALTLTQRRNFRRSTSRSISTSAAWTWVHADDRCVPAGELLPGPEFRKREFRRQPCLSRDFEPGEYARGGGNRPSGWERHRVSQRRVSRLPRAGRRAGLPVGRYSDSRLGSSD